MKEKIIHRLNKSVKVVYAIIAVVVSWYVGCMFSSAFPVDFGVLAMGAFILLNPIKNETVSPDKERIEKLEERIAELEKKG